MWTLKQLMCYWLVLTTVAFGHVYSDEEDYDPCKAAGIIQGDIALEKRQSRFRRAATGHRGRLWKDGVIPYDIELDYTGDQKAVILQAMKHWEKYTCLSFIERTSDDVDYIYFHKGRCGCCSFVGRKGNGRQGISIGKNCDKFGIVVHEIGHVVGFWHEHTRPDREKFVTIIRDNIKKGEEHNFQKLTSAEIDSRNEKYDYGSIMHYGKYTFSSSLNHVTILPKRDPATRMVPAIGQRDKLSPGDIRQTLKMYRCPECGTTMQGPKGEFRSPGHPKPYPADKHCEWRISVTPGERIVLNFTDFSMKKGKSCKQDFVEVRDGHGRKSNLIGRFCGKKAPSTIWSTGNRLWIKFKSGSLGQRPKHGFAARYETRCGGPIRKLHGTIQSPKYPSWYPPNKECVWTIELPSKKLNVGLRFVAFDIEGHEQCHYDYLELFNGPDVKSQSLGKFCGKKRPSDIRSNSSYLTLKFKSDSSISKPGFYVSFFAEQNECENTNGGCAQLCLNTLGHYKCDCYPGFELHANGKDCEAACGGTLTNGNGTIMSPSYPSNYPKNKKCTWKITGPKGQRISLKFKDFKLEGSANGNCRYDYVEVRDQHNKLLSRVCGTHIPKTITSPSNVMFVEFNSDHTQSKKGFAAMYYADEDECQENKGGCQHICVNTIGSYRCECKVGFALHNDHHSCKEAAECGATLTALTGVVTSPNYPGVYQHKKDCTWNIIVTPGSHILLSYRFVQIEEANDCRYDYVEAFSGTGSQAESLGRACGKLIPEPVMSKSFNMMIKFHSDALIAKRGFKARYDTYCGAKLHAVNQKRLFYSHPAYGDDTYSPFLKCTWTITAHNGTIIRLRFKEFDIESEKFCSYDVVTVHDGSNSTSPLLGKACGNDRNITREFLSTGNKMFVHFTTDVSIHKKGFIAEYVQVKNKKVDIKLEPIGCFKDLHVEPRPFSMRIGRFDDYDDFNETISYCGLAASKLSLKFFGIQENGECWGGNNDTYSINGPSTDCHNGVGKLGSLMVYRISGGCFPANAVLKLKTGAMATMETLRIGDEVQTLDTSTNEIFYTEVITFLHNEKRQGAFRVVEADDGNKLLISHEHLIYSGKTKDAMDMIYAEKIQPGDYLLSGNKTSRVISVKTVYDRGLYAPMTRHGTMLVNGIYVSCYVYYNPHGKVVYYNPHGIAHNLMTPLRLWYDVSHFLRDVLASIGMKLAVNDGLTGNEMSQGIHGYIRFLEALSKYLPQNLLVTVSKFETMISI